jgi:hypothetical protein
MPDLPTPIQYEKLKEEYRQRVQRQIEMELERKRKEAQQWQQQQYSIGEGEDEELNGCDSDSGIKPTKVCQIENITCKL